jgi:hypothetical protein
MKNNLQTTMADVLVAIEPWGNELWFIAGASLISLLAFLALVRYLDVQERYPGRAADALARINTDTVFLGLCIFTIFLLRLPGLSRLELAHGDEGGLIAGALTLLHDPRFWLSVDNTTIGPVSTFSLTLIHFLGGTINYGTIKLLGIFVWILVTLFLFLTFLNFYGSKVARLAVLPVVACAATFNVFDNVAFNGEHMPVLLLAAAIWLFSKMETAVSPRDMVYAGLTGIVLGLVPYSKVQAAPIAAAFGVLLVFMSFYSGNRRYLPLIAGGLIPTVLLAIYLFTSGAFEDFWQSYILNNLTYANEGFFGKTKDITLLSNVGQFPAYLTKLHDTRYFFITQFSVILAGTLVLIAFIRSLSRRDTAQMVVAWLVVLASIYSILLPKNNWTHYLLLLIVPLTLLYGSMLGSLASLVSQGRLPHRRGIQDSAVILLLFISVLLPSAYVLLKKNVAFEMAASNRFEGRYYSDIALEIFKYARPDERIGVWGFAYYYEETGMAQGTREAHTERQTTPGPQQAYYINRWIKDLNTLKPPVLLEAVPAVRHIHRRLQFHPDVKAHVDRLYEQVTSIEGIKVFVLKERLDSLWKEAEAAGS